MSGLFSQSSSITTTSIDTFAIYGWSTLPSAETGNKFYWPIANVFELVRTNVSDNTPTPPWSTPDLFFSPRQFNHVNSSSLSKEYSIMTVGIGASLDCRYVGSSQKLDEFEFGWNVTGPSPSDLKVDFPVHRLNLEQILDECAAEYESQGWRPIGPAIYFPSKNITAYNGTACDPYIPIIERHSVSLYSNHSLYGVLCWPKLQIYNANVVLDSNNLVQDYEIHAILDNSTSPFSNPLQHLQGFNTYFQNGDVLSVDIGEEGADPPYEWPGLLTARIQNLSHPYSKQNPVTLMAAANRTFAQTFASFWALHSDSFLTKDPGPVASRGTAKYRIARMVPSIPAFAVTFSLLTLYIIAIMLVHRKRQEQITPRIPNSVGTIFPWIVHSRILRDLKGTSHLSSKLRNEYLDRLGKEYQFGWFRDEQGVVRLGLEESKYVFQTWKSGQMLPTGP